MNFSRYLHACSISLILVGFFSVLITQSYVIPVLIGLVVTLSYAAVGERLASFFRIPRMLWNILAILIFSYLTFDTFYGERDLVGNGIKFVLYLQIVKLLSPKTNRDHFQIYLLSFLHILASTVLSSDISFVIPFLLYIVLATWTLTLFNLKVQQESVADPYRRRAAVRSLLRSKKIITPRFLVSTSLLSISIISFTMVIFFLFPRLSLGKFLKRVGARQHVSGFGEQVELGTIGNIKSNDSIALRIELAETKKQYIDYENLYWRGTAADLFDGRIWSKTFTEKRRIRIDQDTGSVSFKRMMLPGERTLEHRVFMEPMSTQILFAADRMYSLTWSRNVLDRIFGGSLALRGDWYGGIHFASSQSFVSDLSFEAESIVGKPDPAILRKASTEYPYWVTNYFLQLPSLDPEVEKLLEAIPVDSTQPLYDQVAAIKRFLENNYTYTVDVQDRGTANPLRFFFVERKKGHCEYFSTAMIMALRYHGIPAQHVLGFRGGEFNPIGEYLAVRQSDAHSWVEVYFPKVGWVRFDPSPSESFANRPGQLFKRVNQFFDYVRLRWNKYIIEYDLRAQATGLERVGRKIAGLMKGVQPTKESATLERDDPENGASWWKRLHHQTFLWVGLGLLVMFILFRVLRRRYHASTLKGPFGEALIFLQKQGFRREPYETMDDFRRRIEKKTRPSHALRSLVLYYHQERFNHRRRSPSEWKPLLEALTQEFSTPAPNVRSQIGPESSRRAA